MRFMDDGDWYLLAITDRPQAYVGGDAVGVSSLRARFDQAASELQRARDDLRAVNERLDWSGEGADAFKRIITENLPRDLDKVAGSCAAISQALQRLPSALNSAQSELARLGRDARYAHAPLNQAATAGTQVSIDPYPQNIPLENARSAARGVLNDFHDTVISIVSAIDEAMRGFQDDANTWWDAHTPDVLHSWDGVLHAVADAAAIAGIAALVLCSGGLILAVIAGVALLADTALYMRGDGEWYTVVLDAVTLGHGGIVKGAGGILRRLPKAGRAATEIDQAATGVSRAKGAFYTATKTEADAKVAVDSRQAAADLANRDYRDAHAAYHVHEYTAQQLADARSALQHARAALRDATYGVWDAQSGLAGIVGGEIGRQRTILHRINVGLHVIDVGSQGKSAIDNTYWIKTHWSPPTPTPVFVNQA